MSHQTRGNPQKARERNRLGGLGLILVVCFLPINVFACDPECCYLGENCYLDEQFGTSCICEEPEPEPEISFCEHGYYLKWNGTRWVCDQCPSKWPENDGGHHLSSCYIENDSVCGNTCILQRDGTSYCFGDASGKHMEYDENDNLICYDNEVPCRNFGATGCSQSDQDGNAHWEWINNYQYGGSSGPGQWTIGWYMAWDVNECKCEQSVNISNYNCTGKRTANLDNNVVTDMLGRGSYEQAVYSRRDSIKYHTGINYYYCTNCDAGKYPKIFDKENVPRPYTTCRKNDDSAYIACACSDVEVGFFSTGCQIAYPLNTLAIPNSCHQSCQNGLTTLQVGATSSDACVPDPLQRYCDATGCFSLGTNSNVCN